MGAETLVNFHLWRDWKKIFNNIPIAIFDRPSYSLNISKTKTILHFKEDRINSKLSKDLKFLNHLEQILQIIPKLEGIL